MNAEGFEEWDADFLDQLIQVEELALSATQQPPPQPLQPPPAPPFHIDPSHDNANISYSPPRELSQRTTDYKDKPFNQSSNGSATSIPRVGRSGNANEVEIDRLKRELGRVSKNLTFLEQECLELRKERDKKEEQLKSVFSLIEAKDTEVHCLKTSVGREFAVLNQDHSAISLQCRNANTSNEQVAPRVDIATSTSKAIGIQTDKAGDSTHLTINSDLSTHRDPSNKLLAIWDFSTGHRFGRNLVSKLLVACPADFHVLFGCLKVSSSSKITADSLEDGSSSDVALQNNLKSFHSSESAKVSHLYTVLTKIGNGMVQLEALFEALLNLCNLENAVIIYRSLRILRVVLNNLLSLERKSERRDNVMVEGLCSRSDILDFHGSESAKMRGIFCVSSEEASCSGHIPVGMKIFDSEVLSKRGCCNHGNAISSSCVDWVSLFELMHRIITRNIEEHIRYEAVYIMNVIFLRSIAYEREKFDPLLVFESVSQLLRKEAGLRVQKQAVHLLYLLLNCPKMLVIFCSGCKEQGGTAGANDDAKRGTSFRGFSIILEGLADCVASCGSDAQDLKLRRNAIIVLAFLASSGNSGFEILLSHKLSKRTNFLVLILRALVSEMDIEAAAESAEPPELLKERTLLIREVLIFLNRLVSNPAYSSAVLRVLTSYRDVTSLTIDVANRLSRKGQRLWQSDSMTRQMRESETVDLARVFKKRVFNFLGDNIS